MNNIFKMSSVLLYFSLVGCGEPATEQVKLDASKYSSLKESFDRSQTKLDKDFEGHVITDIASKLEAKKHSLQPRARGEFETAQEYKIRISNFYPLKTHFGILKPENHYLSFYIEGFEYDLNYDIDKQYLNIKIDNLLYDITVDSKFKTNGYIGENAFGKKVRVKEENNTWHQIRFNKERGIAFRGG